MIYQYICSYQPITLLFIGKIELLHRSLDLDYTGTVMPATHVLCPLMLLKTFKILKDLTFLLIHFFQNLQHKNNHCYLVPLRRLD